MNNFIWHYPKIWALGSPMLEGLLLDSVVLEEKVDGSQFSFAKKDGVLHYRSKGAIVYPETAGMFALAVAEVEKRKDLLVDGYVYRAEYLQKPKHNTLVYSRTPIGNLVLLDIESAPGQFIPAMDKESAADFTGLECIPRFDLPVEAIEEATIKQLLEKESFLGGTPIEGIVIKNYVRCGKDGKVLMGKYVSEAFKERHNKEWKVGNPGRKDVITTIVESLRTPARWNKSIQHLRDKNQLTDTPQDIGPLLRELKEDLKHEEMEYIKLALYNYFEEDILRGAIRGFPEYFKEWLLTKQVKRTY